MLHTTPAERRVQDYSDILYLLRMILSGQLWIVSIRSSEKYLILNYQTFYF